MPLYQPYNMTRLLNAFPLQQLQVKRVGQARQLIGLVKQGMAEYSNRLEGLDQQLAQQPGGGSENPYDTTSVSYAPSTPLTEVSVQTEQGSTRLTESQIQHVFEELARHHGTLVRGLPDIYQFDDEQAGLFPNTQRVSRDEIEDAWEDWSDEHSKRLFRRHRDRDDDDDDHRYRRRRYRLSQHQLEVIFRRLRREGRRRFPDPDEVHEEQREMYPDTRPVSSDKIEDAWDAWIDEGRRREFRRDRAERGEEEREEHGRREEEREEHRRRRRYRGRDRDEDDEDEDRDRGSDDDDRDVGRSGTPLSRAHIHHLFEVLNYHREILNPEGYPYVILMREEQGRIYPGTRLVSRGEIEHAWHTWHDPEAKEAFRERSEEERRDEREEEEYEERERGEEHERREEREHEEERERREGRERHAGGRGEEEHERDTGRLFEIFDQMIFEDRLSSDNLPIFWRVNRRCEEYGLREFRNFSALLHQWRGYLVAAARAREAEIGERRDSHSAEHAERHPSSEHPTEPHPPSGHPEPGRTSERHGRREEPGEHGRGQRTPRSRTTPRRPGG